MSEKCCKGEFEGYDYTEGRETYQDGLETAGYGKAVTDSYISEGKMWVGNGEYSNEVNYCPFCGRESPALNE